MGFAPFNLKAINISGSLKAVVFENCYQGGSNRRTNDNEKKCS